MTKPKATTDTGRKRYRVVTGLNYRDKRREPGDIVADLPKDSISWLEERGFIVAIKDELKGKEAEPDAVQDSLEVAE